MIENASLHEVEKGLELMVVNTVEAVIKLNTKISACIASKMEEGEKREKLDTYNKKLFNLIYILYPGREFARKILEEKHKEYLYILDFVERKYVENIKEA